MMNEDQQDILLYWSGEADGATTQRVERLLESDSWAQEYLNELRGLKDGWKAEEDGVPEHRRDLLLEAIEDAGPSPGKIQPIRSAWRSSAILSAIAAALVLMATAVFFFDKPESAGGENIVELPPPDGGVVTPAETHDTKRTTLSERLLSRSEPFRRTGGGLDSLREKRERREKLRSNQYKS